MKERPILFSGPMVRAILDGRKTQTRRVLKPQPLSLANQKTPWCSIEDLILTCPYGVPGDRLWVRETWARRLDEDHLSAAQLSGKWAWYWADPQTCNTGCAGAAGKKRVSIHMPRWASRTTLEITEILVERLQAISSEDAEAEGVQCWPLSAKGFKDYYRELWNKINAERGFGWDVNPFVWVIRFKRVTNG